MSSDLLLQKPDDREMANLVLEHWGTWEEDQPFSLALLETSTSH